MAEQAFRAITRDELDALAGEPLPEARPLTPQMSPFDCPPAGIDQSMLTSDLSVRVSFDAPNGLALTPP